VGVDEEDQGVQEAHVVAVKELDACKPGAPYAPAILGYWFGVGEGTLQIHHLISSYTPKKKN
jgi:hypothetical protein